jgi:hypothetical protein
MPMYYDFWAIYLFKSVPISILATSETEARRRAKNVAHKARAIALRGTRKPS